MIEAMKAAGYNKPGLVQAILDKIAADGVDLKEFNDDQKKAIIISYAAGILAV